MDVTKSLCEEKLLCFRLWEFVLVAKSSLLAAVEGVEGNVISGASILGARE